MRIRPMATTDLKTVMVLEHESFIDSWTAEHFAYELNANPYAHLFVAEQDDIILGFIDFWIMFEQATINQIAVAARFRKQGIGSIILADSLKRLNEAGCHQVTLEVRLSNLSGQAFYEKFGFTTILRKPKYYSDGEDALYMGKTL